MFVTVLNGCLWGLTRALVGARTGALPPQIVNLTPANNATAVATNTTVLAVTFDENIVLTADTSLRLEISRLNDGVVVSYPVNSGNVVITGKVMRITVPSLGDTKAYRVRIPSGFVENFVGQIFTGLEAAQWAFISAGKLRVMVWRRTLPSKPISFRQALWTPTW